MSTEKQERNLAVEFTIETGDTCDVQYKNKNIGPFFNAKITGSSRAEVFKKTRQVIGDIAILSRGGNMDTVNAIYDAIMDLKKDLESGNGVYVFERYAGKWDVSLLLVANRVYTVEV